MRNAITVYGIAPSEIAGMRLSFLATLAGDDETGKTSTFTYELAFRRGWTTKFRDVVGLNPSTIKVAVDAEWERYKRKEPDYWTAPQWYQEMVRAGRG